MTDCPVCYDSFTAHKRKQVKCPYCDLGACVVCTKRYLTESLLDAHCMGCRRAWNDEFLDINFTKSFRTGVWKKHREDVLMDREMAILPTRQARVESTILNRKVAKEMSEVSKEIRSLEIQRSTLFHKLQQLDRKRTRYSAEARGDAPPAWTLEDGEEKKVEKERAKFIMKCPDAECRGFLSTAYKCGTCQKWSCPDCLEIKGEEKDAEHTCNEERKASVKLILEESKPCPKCGERIGKVSGCDQMWCTSCNTAFSWITGQQVNGVIHNPHYYEFLRKQGNGVAPRNAGDIPCGGVPYYHHLHTAIAGRTTLVQLNIIMSIHRITSEIADQRIQGYQGAFNQNDNGDLGVLYLMKEIDKEQMKKELAKRETKRNKHLAIRAVLEMFVNTSTMMLNAIVNQPPKSKQEVDGIIEEFNALKKYVNESLMLVSKNKNCSVPQIGVNKWDAPKKKEETVEESKTWSWIPFNKVVSGKVKAKPSTAAAGGGGAVKEEESDDETDSDSDSLVEDIIEGTV
jgi:hypothetical protein